MIIIIIYFWIEPSCPHIIRLWGCEHKCSFHAHISSSFSTTTSFQSSWRTEWRCQKGSLPTFCPRLHVKYQFAKGFYGIEKPRPYKSEGRDGAKCLSLWYSKCLPAAVPPLICHMSRNHAWYRPASAFLPRLTCCWGLTRGNTKRTHDLSEVLRRIYIFKRYYVVSHSNERPGGFWVISLYKTGAMLLTWRRINKRYRSSYTLLLLEHVGIYSNLHHQLSMLYVSTK